MSIQLQKKAKCDLTNEEYEQFRKKYLNPEVNEDNIKEIKETEDGEGTEEI